MKKFLTGLLVMGCLALMTACPSALQISTTQLPNAIQGTAYVAQVQASGGTTPYFFAIAPGDALPFGMTLEGSTGVISGTPIGVGTFTFTVEVTDAGTNPQSASVQVKIKSNKGAK